MMLIDCPYCGPRNETEFGYGGEAHVAYPEDPYALSDREWGEFLFYRDTPKATSPNGGSTAAVAANGSTRSATP